MARIQRGAKNAGETRGRGSLQPVAQSLGSAKPGEGVRPLGDLALPAPRLALVHSAWLVRERPESRELDAAFCQRDAPTPLFSVLLLGPDGYRRKDLMNYGAGRGFAGSD